MSGALVSLIPAQPLRGSNRSASRLRQERRPSELAFLPEAAPGFARGLSVCVPFLLISPIDRIEDITYIVDINNGGKP